MSLETYEFNDEARKINEHSPLGDEKSRTAPPLMLTSVRPFSIHGWMNPRRHTPFGWTHPPCRRVRIPRHNTKVGQRTTCVVATKIQTKRRSCLSSPAHRTGQAFSKTYTTKRATFWRRLLIHPWYYLRRWAFGTPFIQ